MTPRCAYAACDVIAVYPDQGWDFCWQHYCEHRADMYGEPWPDLKPVNPTTLLGYAPCGTPAAYRRHYRKGEKPCVPCSEAIHRQRFPDNPTLRRGSWYRPEAS
jgi:hypothetical protein